MLKLYRCKDNDIDCNINIIITIMKVVKICGTNNTYYLDKSVI